MDAIRGNNDISLGGGAIGECHPRHVAILLEAGGSVTATDDA